MNKAQNFIVLDRRAYKESDALITCYVEGVGVLNMIARGANKPTSKYGSLLQPLRMFEGFINVRPGLSLFKTAKLKNRYPDIEASILALAVASFIAKVLANNAMDDAQMISYDTLASYLQSIDDQHALSVGTHFLMRLAQKHGVALYLEGCVICKSKQVSALSLIKGGFLCPAHETMQPAILHDVEFFKQLRCLSKADIHQIHQCGSQTNRTHMGLYVGLLEQIIAIPHKNWKFIQQI